MRTSVQTGMSLAQIGEFSFILASLGTALGATRDFLYPIAVAVSGGTAAAAHARPQELADAYHQAIAWSDQLAPAAAV